MADDDLTSKNCVWVPDKDELFVRGSITDYLANGVIRVSIKNGVQEEIREMEQKSVESCNPAKFNKCEDMAELTHLNEPSVIYNLFLRYNDDLIYTYLGLFLVAINPYKKLPIYENLVLRSFHGLGLKADDRLPPHIFAIAENSHRNLVANKKDQSILVTGESGAGKTENTKKIIQYLSLISTLSETGSSSEDRDDIHEKILRANPILESFGNAKTIKNNNSSRFGKFIKIYFDSHGIISGATIDYYLLEKSRVSHQLKAERNYHVFYQMLQGESEATLASKYSLSNDLSKYRYLSSSAGTIPQIDDAKEFRHLNESFRVMGFSESDIENIFAGLAIILHLGNVDFISWKADQASFAKDANLATIASLLGVSEDELSKNLLKPKVKAGREFMHKLQKASDVKSTIDAFAKYLYEKLFQFIITRIDSSLMTDDVSTDHFIGVLDIAGFEIFEMNSFEQLCINYTNEKLQQYFNHHSFILEQSEYLREDIQWEYIDFGLDLQPTIDLIETKQPMGVLEILNEQCILPKASETTFMEKLLETWGNGETRQFKPNKTRTGFIIDHYAGDVEYNIDDWLQKNKDPVSDNVLDLVRGSTNPFFKDLFMLRPETASPVKSKGKSPKFKTVTQKHKEHLSNLMQQLSSTEPHFVRCILPNLSKRANKFDKELVLHQLRCNGVLEGIRIARAGYPNKMTFEEFFERYSILNWDDVFTKNLKSNCELILKHIALDAESFKIGITKLFFKNGVLGLLEELRDSSIKRHLTSFQSLSRGQLARTKIKKQISLIQASQVIARNFQKLDGLVNNSESPWLKLFVRLKPLLEDSVKVLDSREMNESLKQINGKLKETEASKIVLENENTSLKERLQSLEDDIIKAADAASQKMDKLKSLERDEQSRSAKLDDTLRQLSEVQAVSAALAKEKVELLGKLEESQKTIANLESQVELLENERNTQVEAVKTLEAKVKNFAHIEADHQKALGVVKTLEQKCKSHSEISKSLDVFKSNIEEKDRNLASSKTQIEANESRISELEALIKSSSLKNEELMKSTMELKLEFSATLKSLKEENMSLKADVSKLSGEKAALEESLENQKKQLGEASDTRVNQMQKAIDDLRKSLKDAAEKEKSLQSQFQEKSTALEGENRVRVGLEGKVAEYIRKLENYAALEQALTIEKQQHSETVAGLKSSKDSLALAIDRHKTSMAEYEKMKNEMHYLTRVNTEYTDQINSLRDQISALEAKLLDKENLPPKSQQMDPEIMSEYVAIKAKLNEQSAALRNEKFENQKLSEEVRMLRQKVSDSFESPLKRSEARRSLAMGDDLRLSQMSDSRYAEEVKELKVQLKQEEANAVRAENYAIELQKKLNRFQATRGINTFTDYEVKFKESQARVEELEKKIVTIISESLDCSPDLVRQAMSRSNSLGSIIPLNSVDFARIYNDINHTLKTTRDELSKSKSEILRLKSLLRESEDELYEVKRDNMKTSVRDYEEQLAKLKVENIQTGQKLGEVQRLFEKFKARSEEYYEKLELAESAVHISKRHEDAARRELEDKNTELKLIREEIRASEKVIRQLRQDNDEAELKYNDVANAGERLKGQVKTLQAKIEYLNSTYGDRKNAIESHKEEIKSLREDVRFKLEKETEIIKENKRLMIDNDELLRIKEEVLAENKEVTEENEELVQTNESLKTRVLQLQNEKQAHERKIDQSNKLIESLRMMIEENGRQMEALNSSNQNLERQKDSLESEAANLTSQLNDANRSLKILQDHVENLETEKKQTRLELDDLRSRWDNSDGRYKEARTENLVIVQENESLKTVNSELRRKVEDLESKIYSNEQLRYLESSVGRLNDEIDQLKGKLSEGDLREQGLRKQIATLEYERESKSSQLKKYNDENFNYQNMIGQYKGKIEYLFQENSEKDLKIKAQERELVLLREKFLLLEKERLVENKV
ncbi:myosin protein heavy chain [Metschnikowia aff. pulcherrima]|uniref:Myosin protein heavy chain n=1 Tax=Metschnikowia aff. pulcherrima TaxID=2163413 RepID=A0A4P6XUS5_9ASCO|nr:myosin protein heavy chain [Metschnikowia aff. pulcherrima]